MNTVPRITIVTVCFNAVDTIENTILSVLQQSYANKEYIIVDGSSTDGTYEVIQKYESQLFLFISEPDSGIYDAMNKGIMAATGDWIIFMNAGDEFINEGVLLSVSSSLNNADIVYGDTMLIFSGGQLLKKPYPIQEIVDRMVFGHQATFVRTSYHKQHLFDISYKSSADFKFLREAYLTGGIFKYIPITIVNYDAENGISSRNCLQSQREDARIKGIDDTIKWKLAYITLYAKILIKKFLRTAIRINTR